MSSNHAFHTIPGCFPYNVAKSALTGLVQSLAIEWGPAIRVVGVAPGFIDTPGNQAWFDSFPDPSAERELTESRAIRSAASARRRKSGTCAPSSPRRSAVSSPATPF